MTSTCVATVITMLELWRVGCDPKYHRYYSVERNPADDDGKCLLGALRISIEFDDGEVRQQTFQNNDYVEIAAMLLRDPL